MADGLKPKHKAFAEAYLSNGGNAYRAALTAGYSETFARAKSYQLLEREDIQDYIAQRRKQMARRAVSPERVLLELAAICVAAVATILDNATGANGMLRALALGFYVANEALSLLENAGRMGVPLPRKLLDALEQVKAKTE